MCIIWASIWAIAAIIALASAATHKSAILGVAVVSPLQSPSPP